MISWYSGGDVHYQVHETVFHERNQSDFTVIPPFWEGTVEIHGIFEVLHVDDKNCDMKMTTNLSLDFIGGSLLESFIATNLSMRVEVWTEIVEKWKQLEPKE